MKGQPKKPKYVARRERRILGDNIRRRMERRYADEGDKWTAMADACGVSRSTIQRLVKGEVGATIDVIAQCAHALRCEPYELLTPRGKDPADRSAGKTAG